MEHEEYADMHHCSLESEQHAPECRKCRTSGSALRASVFLYGVCRSGRVWRAWGNLLMFLLESRNAAELQNEGAFLSQLIKQDSTRNAASGAGQSVGFRVNLL